MIHVWHLAAKDLVLLSRDWMAMFFLLGFPVLMGVLFGVMYQGIGTPKPGGIAVVVIDEDQSKISRALIEHLRDNPALKIDESDLETGREMIKKQQVVGLVVIPAGYGDTAGIFWESEQVALRVGRDPSRSAEAAMLEGYLMEAAGKLMATRFQDTTVVRDLIEKQKLSLQQDDNVSPFNKILLNQLYASLDSLCDNIDQVTNSESPTGEGNSSVAFEIAKIETFDAFQQQSSSVDSKIRSGWDISFPAAILWGVMGSAAGFAISLVRERSRGTLLRLQTAPISSMQIVLGKGFACFLATAMVVAVMIGLGLGLGLRPGSPLLLLGSTIVVAFCFVGIMMAMSALGSTEEAVGGAGWAINIVMAMFGGGMIPLAFMPGFMNTLSNFSPVKWAILSLEAAIWRDYSLTEILVPWTILMAIGVAGLFIGLVLFRRK